MAREYSYNSMMRTKGRLQVLVDNAYRRPVVNDLIELYFLSSLDLDPESAQYKLQRAPWWVWEGLVENASPYIDRDKYRCDVVTGYHDSKQARRVRLGVKYDGDTLEQKGIVYEYIDSIPLPSEVELQAEDGDCVVAYRGESFLRIWEPKGEQSKLEDNA